MNTKIEYPKIAQEIMDLVRVDQKMRKKNLIDDKYWRRGVDVYNSACLRNIIRLIGWPTRSKVGKVASHGAWLIAQHADHDPNFQKMCLRVMSMHNPPEIELRDLAHLQDRILINTGKPQLYGTRFTQVGERHVPRPIRDRGNLNRRRKKMGLPPFKQGLAEMYKKYPF